MTLRILPRRCRAEKGSESLSCPAIASRVTARRNEHTDAMMSSRERKRHLHCPSWRESAKVTSLAPVSPTPIGAVKVIRAERPEFYNGDTIILAGLLFLFHFPRLFICFYCIDTEWYYERIFVNMVPKE
ncbi:uncharacterized protein An07g04750 [Aspergillus niger]|uniref:Contig An07c0130, genomic contig n=2 Tax=Aspergillus niger TaxID=5061 RepID=A2QN85_ASPNC|nr:uncharacterized protein An07g04750 [Aspergillus niger]CAK39394.1 unnamed protein product [Aspergillus niger]